MNLPFETLDFLKGGCLSNPQSLLITLHGYGASADDIAPLAKALTNAKNQTLLVTPNAPNTHPESQGYFWFPIQTLSEEELSSGTKAVLPSLQNWVSDLQKELNISPEKTSVVGFSQGGMLALCINQGKKVLAKKVLCFSGGSCLLPQELDDFAHYQLVHGTDDVVVPLSMAIQTVTAYKKFCPNISLHQIQFSLLLQLQALKRSFLLHCNQSFLIVLEFV